MSNDEGRILLRRADKFQIKAFYPFLLIKKAEYLKYSIVIIQYSIYLVLSKNKRGRVVIHHNRFVAAGFDTQIFLLFESCGADKQN